MSALLIVAAQAIKVSIPTKKPALGCAMLVPVRTNVSAKQALNCTAAPTPSAGVNVPEHPGESTPMRLPVIVMD